MIPVCSEAEIIGCIHEAVAIHHLYDQLIAVASQQPQSYAAMS